MLNLIRKAILMHHYKEQIEAELELCRKLASQLSKFYEPQEYNILDEVEELCQELEGE